jgi:SAM-dependent methyltransferase
MDLPPEDPAARREWLERWVTEQAEKGEIPEQRGRAPAWTSRALRKARMTPLRLQLRIATASERLGDRFLDRDLRTAGQVQEPEHDHPERVQYVPSPWHVLPRALRYLRVSEDDVFVDFGCGKGRILHQAAKRPFRRVIGVEISPVLADIARRAVAQNAHQHRCRDVQVVASDVRDFQVPDDLTVGYLFHPFKDETLDAVMRHIVESLDRKPRRVRLIYVHPYHASQILATGRFRLLKEQRSRLLDTQISRTSIFESTELG